MQVPDFDFDINLEDFDVNIDFDVNDNLHECRYIKPPAYNYIRENLVKYKNAEKLANDINYNGFERVHVLLAGSFIFGDFIEAFIVKHNIKCQRLIISTLSMSQENVDSLANLINGEFVDKLDLIISDYFFSHERNGLIKYMYKTLDKKNKFQLAVAGIHTKTCLIKTEGGKYIVINGSANLRTSGNLEEITIQNDKELFKFHAEWQDLVVEKYKTINKSIRVSKLDKLINIK